MSDDDIRALREALADGPTPGPWEDFPVGHGSQRVARVNNREVVPPDACELAHEIVDARYIAAASPDRIARLLAEVERLRAFERGVIEAIPGPRYMDPPDGGDVTPLEQVRRMAAEVERLRGALDALGVAIADAGYTWTPEMRTAYEGAANQDGGEK